MWCTCTSDPENVCEAKAQHAVIDPLNGEAAALMLREPEHYAARIRDCVAKYGQAAAEEAEDDEETLSDDDDDDDDDDD